MRSSALLLALALAAALPAVAHALPGDPPIEPLSPADGATVPANPDGVGVSFQCPDYRVAVYSVGDTTYVQSGDYADYDVRYSTSPALGPDGRLAEQDLGSDENVSGPPADGLTCTSLLNTVDNPSAPELVGGRVFWQAYRYCNGCAQGGPEVGPVRSFVVRAQVDARLRVAKRLYAGYLSVFKLESKAVLPEAEVLLQRRAGKRWKTVVKTGYRTDETEIVAALPAGRQRLRARISTAGRSFDVAQRTVSVRRGGRRTTSASDDGRYAARKPPKNSTLKFRIAGGGTTLRGFKASLAAFCVGPTLEDNRVVVAFALLRSARVAPDGSVTGHLKLKSGARILLTGRLSGRRFKGKVAMSFSTCAGTRKLDAVRR